MRHHFCFSIILLIFVLMIAACGSDDTIAPPVEAPEGSRYVAFEVHRNSQATTAAAYTKPDGLFTEPSLLTVGKGGRGLIHHTHTWATPLFLDTEADLLDVNIFSSASLSVCGAREEGAGAVYLYHADDEWRKVAHSFAGNFTGCWGNHICSDDGAILQYDPVANVISLLFQAPEGVSFQALVGDPKADELVALGDGGAIYHRRAGGGFVDESIAEGPDFVAASLYFEWLEETPIITFFTVGDDEIWKYENDSWTRVYDLAKSPLAGVITMPDGRAFAAGGGGLVLKEDQYGWWDWSIEADCDISALALNPTDLELDACGTRGEVFVEDNVDWIDLEHHAEGPWAAFHQTDDGQLFAANAGRVMHFGIGGWEEVAAWDWGGSIMDLHVLGASDIWAIGVMDDGVDYFVLHYDGAAWAVKMQASLDGFNALWCDARGENVFVAADYGTIWWHHGDLWEMVVNLGVDLDFHDIAGTTIHDLRAVGEGGTIMRRGSESWAVEPSGTSMTLRALSGSVAVGDAGTILRHDGTDWNQVDHDLDSRLLGVWSNEGGNDIWAVGEDAAVMQFDGTTWTRLLTHLPGIDFLSVQGSGDTDVWIGGTEGYLLKNPTPDI